ncbi:MAG: ATP-dependent DNA helicase RecG, partial [Firmicutes bacterium]|nr:ATP-dependent DNA helicase RecG [Bacillota bacterium]
GLGSIFMAPTALLAEQHYNTLSRLLAPDGLNTARVTGSMTAAERNAVKKRISEGYYSLIIGTHALFSEGMEYGEKIALVITDEQHRFGVAQRARIIEKAGNPHVLVMSATPIPRTLALIIYGDLSISILDEMPPGRQKVDTFAVDSSYRQRINAFIRKQVQEGHQVFVVCPMIDENEEIGDVISAEEHAAYLKKELPELKVALLHGKTPNKEKDKIMNDFVLGKSDILVSTTIIEVGIDVPNASLIVIENAERFGLSQLHQLRGRVGRGEAKSYCVLFSDHRSEEVRARLKVMCETNDGFRVAEEDLRQRGPGDFFGSAQHGLPELHIADLGTDVETLRNAQSEAERVMESDPLLERPEHALLKAKIDAMFDVSRDTFN